jgi:hypothetical protein
MLQWELQEMGKLLSRGRSVVEGVLLLVVLTRSWFHQPKPPHYCQCCFVNSCVQPAHDTFCVLFSF